MYKCDDPNCEECDFDNSTKTTACTKCTGDWRLNPEHECETTDPQAAAASESILRGSVASIALSALKGPDMFASFNFIQLSRTIILISQKNYPIFDMMSLAMGKINPVNAL